MTATKRRLTGTAAPPADDSRYRKTWGTSQECAHRWAANLYPEGRAGNVFFEGGVIYSYGRHFPVARWVRLRAAPGPVVFFTSRGYSSSTARHKSEVRKAVPGSATVYTVPDVLADTRAEHRANLDAYQSAARDQLLRAGKARQRRTAYVAEAARLLEEGTAYAAAVGLRERVGPPDGSDLMGWAEKAFAADRERAALQVKRERSRLAGELAEWGQKLAAWQDGGDWPGECPDPSDRSAYLRVKGAVLETSRRAAVPLRAALPVLAAVRGGDELPAGFGVDGFRVEGFDREARTVTVGCHVVTFEEIERAAAKAGL